MLHKTAGIALGFIKYKETSIIARIYTEQFGLQSYIINGVRSSSAKSKIALFQPLTLLDLVVYKNDQKNIQRLSEIKCSTPFFEIPYKQIKTSLALFVTEVISKITSENEEDPDLFHFLHTAIQELDNPNNHNPDFHLVFLYRLLLLLGISPNSLHKMAEEIQHRSGYLSSHKLDTLTLVRLESELPTDWLTPWTKKNEERAHLLSLFVSYFQHHFDHFKNLKSVDILHEVLRA